MSMRAVLVNGGKGPVESLVMGTVPRPTPAAHHVLVKVRAFALNRMDVTQRMGRYPVPKHAPSILGVDFSGTVVGAGSRAARWNEGDEVFGITVGGAYAEYVSVPYTHIMPKPNRLSWIEAASIPEVWLTAYNALLKVCDLAPREDVLIHAGGSGVGIAATQLARHLGANTVTTTVRSQDKAAWLRGMSLGPTRVVNVNEEDFAEVVAGETDGRGVNAILDLVGKAYWERNIASLAVDGRMAITALLSGATVEKMGMQPLLYKRLRIQGSTLRSRSELYQSDLVQRFEREVLPDLSGVDDSGKLKTYIHATYPWDQIQDATRELKENKSIGKVVAEID